MCTDYSAVLTNASLSSLPSVIHFKHFISIRLLLVCNTLNITVQQGSRLKADYEVTWDSDGFSRNAKSKPEETGRWMPSNRYNREAGHQSYNSRFSSENGRQKRFKVGKQITSLEYSA